MLFDQTSGVENKLSVLLSLVFVVNVLLKQGSGCQWEGSEDHVIKGNVKIIEDSSCRISTEECEVELWDGKDHVLVEEVQDHFGNSNVIPSSVNEQEFPQSLEFRNSKVTSLDSSHTFITVDTNTDVSFLDHVNIVSTISNGKSDFVHAILNQSDNLGLLFRSNSTTNNSFASL